MSETNGKGKIIEGHGSEWIIKKCFTGKIDLNDPVLIEGLPGIGNVGKLSVDFMIDEIKPQLLYEIHSHLFPNSVFINDKNVVELPIVCLYAYKSKSGRDILLLSGDVQPIDEESSYKFCNKILDLVKEFGCKEVITLGGIGLHAGPKNPKVFGAVTEEDMIKKYQELDGKIIFNKSKAATIVGAAGLLIGLASLRGWKGVSLLVETIGHRYHLGLREAKELIKNINNIFSLDMDLKALDKEIIKAEKKQEEGGEEEEGEPALFKSLKRLGGSGEVADPSYIG